MGIVLIQPAALSAATNKLNVERSANAARKISEGARVLCIGMDLA